MQEFEGRVAVITGAASGIGRAMAEQAATLGMSVVAADIEEPALAATVEAIAATGARTVAVPTDVADPDAMDRLAEVAFGELGGVHLLCNNAGVFSGGLLWERSLEDFSWVFGVNVFGIIHAIRAFVPRMLEQPGESHIVNTASMGGLITNAYSGPYYASKFAVIGLSECLAHDLASVRARIGVSVLVPSLVATAIGDSERNRPERYRSPVEREPTPDLAVVADALRDATRAGLSPTEVAAMVFDAVIEGRFYIPTKPSFDRQLTERHVDQLARRLPRPPDID